jgi:hypothetical protein
MYHRNVGWHSTDYTALYPRSWYSSRRNEFCGKGNRMLNINGGQYRETQENANTSRLSRICILRPFNYALLTAQAIEKNERW